MINLIKWDMVAQKVMISPRVYLLAFLIISFLIYVFVVDDIDNDWALPLLSGTLAFTFCFACYVLNWA